MRWLESLVVALSMYSKIPMPHISWTKENMRYALCFFPVVGVAVGAVVWLWYQLAAHLPVGNTFVTSVLVLIPVLITGGIHLDGLLDTADALSSWQTKERRLEILKDSHAGAFAIIVCCSYFLAAFGIWSEVDADSLVILCIGFVLSRALNGFGISTFPCAKNSGLAATFANGADKTRCRVVLLTEAGVCILGMLLLDVRRGVLAAATAVVVCVLCRRMAMKTFGGITGDIQGFFLQICELAMAYTVILGGKLWS
jgi:adenosylcobinamide-GDP ribazoletransferase